LILDVCPHSKQIFGEQMPIRKPNALPSAPKYLKPATRAWFAQVVVDFELDEHHLRLLTLAGEAWDRGQQARTEIEKHGITHVDRFGAPRKRPEVSIEAESRISFARILRELDLSVDPPAQGKRPPALQSNRRH
jgi:phage terminase small subunit